MLKGKKLWITRLEKYVESAQSLNVGTSNWDANRYAKLITSRSISFVSVSESKYHSVTSIRWNYFQWKTSFWRTFFYRSSKMVIAFCRYQGKFFRDAIQSIFRLFGGTTNLLPEIGVFFTLSYSLCSSICKNNWLLFLPKLRKFGKPKSLL